METKFHVVYLTTNLINGKQYVGDHSTNNLNDNYRGSGNILVEAFKKYGFNNFERKILEYFETKQEAFDAQEKYIKEYNTLVPNGYNLSPKGGHNVKGCIGEETKKKLSQSLKGKITWMKGKHHSDKTKKLLRDKHLGKNMAEETKNKIAKSNTGKNHTPETKQQIKINNIGKHDITFISIETREKMSKSQMNNKNCVGRKLSQETREKMSKSLKGKIPWNKGLKKCR